MIISKPITTATGPGEVKLPLATHRIDYEGELAVVIGRQGTRVSAANALSLVAGYTVANDLSARDWQFRTTEMMIGKAFDGFCPLGPFLVTPDEVGEPQSLGLKTHVNGELRQDASTNDMIFGVAEIVAYISEVLTLRPGDVIVTGTPAGVGATRQPRVWLSAGDVVEVAIERVGLLRVMLSAPDSSLPTTAN
jgi:2-keto-4-pentenoate hydratase/2-oxohepta-3-ene-1,7-dioic acid hydratase in catechol pathway